MGKWIHLFHLAMCWISALAWAAVGEPVASASFVAASFVILSLMMHDDE